MLMVKLQGLQKGLLIIINFLTKYKTVVFFKSKKGRYRHSQYYTPVCSKLFCGEDGIRTHDLLTASQAL